MKTISKQDLSNILSVHKGATAVSIITLTEPKMRKTNNEYYGRVTRLAERSGMIGGNYENSVNKQREREDIETHFIAEQLWQGKGVHVSSALCYHSVSMEQYLVFYPTRTTPEGHPVANRDSWRLDNVEMDDDTLSQVMSFVSEPSDSPKQGTEKQIPWRTIKLRNIIQLKMMGELYIIK
jgi:hypothetical protein